jgi:hypothetical protein
MRRLLSSVFMLCCLILMGTGCVMTGGSRLVFDIKADPGLSPATGTPVKIVKVTDHRQFKAGVPKANMPSLWKGYVGRKDMEVRAIGRDRNNYGRALENCLLVDGSTVEGLVRDVVTQSFRRQGYRVVDKTDALFSTAKSRKPKLWAVRQLTW